MLTLRPYQTESVQAIYDHFTNHEGSPLIVLPTGTGKSLVIADFVRGALKSYPKTRILMLTHSKELIEQNSRELFGHWPDAPIGIYSAGLGIKDIHAQITFGGIQSVARGLDKFKRPFDLIIIDESHMIPRKATTQYQKTINHFKTQNPSLKLVGLTATPYRLDSGRLDEGDDAMFTRIAYNADIADMIDEGYLCQVTAKATEMKQDVSGVHKRGGDYIPKELQAAVDNNDDNHAACEEMIKKAHDRGSWLIFCAGVEHAKNIRDILHNQWGIKAETVSGDTPKVQRTRILDDFKSGKIQALTNMGVLTTGFNAPGIDMVALLRPTESTGLYIQMVGRGTRITGDKENCLVLDFAGNVRRHGPIDALTVKKAMVGNGEGEAPTKECPECFEIVYAGVRKCTRCDYEFPPPEIAVDKTAYEGAIVARHAEPQWLNVDKMTLRRHKKAGKPPSMKVEYHCGIQKLPEWVCIEHMGYAKDKAVDWMRCHGVIALTVDEALDMEWKVPARIFVRQNGKYFDVLRREF